MLFRRYLPYVIVSLSLVSCWPGKQIDAPAWYKNPAPADTGKLRFDGYYTNISELNYSQQNYTAVDPVFFYSGKQDICCSWGACNYRQRIIHLEELSEFGYIPGT